MLTTLSPPRRDVVLVLVLCMTTASVPARTGLANPPAALSLEEVVEITLRQSAKLKCLTVEYSYVATELQKSAPVSVSRGVFGFDSEKHRLAGKGNGAHAVFEGGTTTYLMEGQGFGTIVGRQASLFGHWRTNPALFFDVMQDTEYTSVPLVLKDAIGKRKFGKAELVEGEHEIAGAKCYVVEGVYDRVALHQLNRPQPVPWKYRLYLDPARDMHIVRKETFNWVDKTPLGVVDIERMVKVDDVWIPVAAKLTSFSHTKTGDGVVAQPSLETVFTIEESTIKLNEPPDDNLFKVVWPKGTQVRDEIKGKVYFADHTTANGDMPEKR